ncbi:hypothetical protein ACX9MO_15380 [Pseudooceanicola sp. 502str34]
MTLLLDAILPLKAGPEIPAAASGLGTEGAPDAPKPTCGSRPVDAMTMERWLRASLHMRERAARPCNRFVERMLADPMIQLVMKADGVSDADVRSLYDTATSTSPTGPAPGFRYQASKHVAQPDAGPRPGSPRPHIGE